MEQVRGSIDWLHFHFYLVQKYMQRIWQRFWRSPGKQVVSLK